MFLELLTPVYITQSGRAVYGSFRQSFFHWSVKPIDLPIKESDISALYWCKQR